MSFRINPDIPGSEVELVHTNLEGDSFFDLGDLDVFGLDRNAGSNPCADANGGCEGLCLFSGTGVSCACSYGRLSADGKGPAIYDVCNKKFWNICLINLTQPPI